jgi:prevent-host-death family protein
MERTMSATEARIHFGEVLRQVRELGQIIVVERDGAPEAVVISVADYERLRNQDAPDWQIALERMTRIKERIEARHGNQAFPPSEDLIREAREERDEQLASMR